MRSIKPLVDATNEALNQYRQSRGRNQYAQVFRENLGQVLGHSGFFSWLYQDKRHLAILHRWAKADAHTTESKKLIDELLDALAKQETAFKEAVDALEQQSSNYSFGGKKRSFLHSKKRKGT